MKARVDQDDRLRRTRMTIVDLAVACGYKKCPLNKPTKSVRIEYSAVFTRTHTSRAIYLYASLDRTTFTGEEVKDSGDEHTSIRIGFADVPAIPTPIAHVFRRILSTLSTTTSSTKESMSKLARLRMRSIA